MKYRDHKGGFSESMNTVQEFLSIEEIKTHLQKNQNKAIAEIKFDYIGNDHRIDWDTYYVLQRFEGQNEFTVAGMSDGIVN